MPRETTAAVSRVVSSGRAYVVVRVLVYLYLRKLFPIELSPQRSLGIFRTPTRNFADYTQILREKHPRDRKSTRLNSSHWE